LPLSDDEAWDGLAARAGVILEDAERWPAWWTEIAPHLERWVASPSFAGRLAGDEDHRREIVVQSWERLQERDHAKLRSFFESLRDGEDGLGRRFRAWLRRVVKNITIDHQRSLPEFVRRRAPAAPLSPSLAAQGQPSHDYWHSIVSITSAVAQH
jgi:hypothetical protein